VASGVFYFCIGAHKALRFLLCFVDLALSLQQKLTHMFKPTTLN